MNKRLLIRQSGYKDCASACLLSIMRFYGTDASLEEISYILRVDKDGTNAYNIINGSRTFGFDGFGSHYSYDDIINENVRLPIICHTIKNNRYHFIVVYNINKKNIDIMDPSSNITKISKEQFKNIYLNTSIVIYPTKKINKVINHKVLFEFIFDYIKIYKNDILKILILSCIVIVLGILSNFYLLIIIDKIIPNYNYYSLILISVIFVFIYLLKNIILYIKDNYLIKVESQIISLINIKYIRKLFNLPYLFFKNKSSSEIQERFRDMKSFKEIIVKTIINTFTNSLFIIISFIVLSMISIKLLTIYIIELLLYLLIVTIFNHSYNRNIESYLTYESEYNKKLNESILGYEDNKNLNMINDITKMIEIKYSSFINKSNIYENNINKEELFKNIIIDLFYIIFVFIGISFINNNILSLGQFILFNSISLYFLNSFKSIIDLFKNITFIKNIYRRINDLFTFEIKNEKIDNYDLYGDINFNNVSISIDGLNYIMNDISFKIKYKSKFLLYSKSGSGKSTLMKTLMKYINNYKGEIYINNINIKDISSQSIHNSFTYVSQNNYLINDTFKNNIIFYRDISLEDYEEVINLCNLNRLRDSKLLRNDFIIEDDGFNISGGEKQKIILARSLLKNSNYIILDEALSEVDLKEEIDIINKIFEKYKDKTIIYISHKEELKKIFTCKYKLERRN